MRMVGFLAPALATPAGQPRLEMRRGLARRAMRPPHWLSATDAVLKLRVTASCENSRASLLRSRWLNALMWGILVRRNAGHRNGNAPTDTLPR
jgi:hypothetical protein